MARVAILGGGLAGLAAAYQCEQLRLAGRPLDWHLFEASGRFGGTVSTTRFQAADGEYILEDGPDGWITEKPWARELAEELGLADEIIACNEARRRTFLLADDELIPMPDRMRLMVPQDLEALEGSPLFSDEAKRAYTAEFAGAETLKALAPQQDESVAAFVRRHFGEEVLRKLAAPLLSGVFGGDVERLSVRAVMPQFVQMEAEHGSLIAGVMASARQRAGKPPQPTFTSLRRGMGSLIEALLQALPPERLHTGHETLSIEPSSRAASSEWLVRFGGPAMRSCAIGTVGSDELMLATPLQVTRQLLRELGSELAPLLPPEASSAVLVTFCWHPAAAHSVSVPEGFGFLVPDTRTQGQSGSRPHLLAGTFADQKYPHRAPTGARVLRAFFGSGGASQLASTSDAEVAALALDALRSILGPMPPPAAELTTVRRWPHSLPQYEVGHLDRVRELERRIGVLGHLRLLGNSYYGVGVPDLIRDARKAARTLSESLT